MAAVMGIGAVMAAVMGIGAVMAAVMVIGAAMDGMATTMDTMADTMADIMVDGIITTTMVSMALQDIMATGVRNIMADMPILIHHLSTTTTPTPLLPPIIPIHPIHTMALIIKTMQTIVIKSQNIRDICLFFEKF
jgi:hypothetical protein